tara:strand:+ start:1787 stop:3076 length:1290 start_codon:yes stop_codon:yes gene_type:complete
MKIKIIQNPINLSIELPGSKSITLRNLILASLANGITQIISPADCDDTREMISCLKSLGVSIKTSDNFQVITVVGTGGRFREGVICLNLGLSGTSARFLIALSLLRKTITHLTGKGKLNERPNYPLLDAIEQLGGKVFSGKNGCLPVSIKGPQEIGRLVTMPGNLSSQFFSALLQIAPLLPGGLKLTVAGELISRPYVEITLNEMKKYNVEVENDFGGVYKVRPQQYKAGSKLIEGDASAASYFAALTLIHGGQVAFRNLPPKTTQGDFRFLIICTQLGAQLYEKDSKTILEGPPAGKIRKVKNPIDCRDIPDAALTLIAIAPLIPGTTLITGLGTLKHKECDRIEAPARELRKLGIEVKTGPDFIEIGHFNIAVHKPDRIININTYQDHRMAMSFAVLGTRIGNLNIKNPEVVGKTYPQFWNDLARLT